MEKIFKREKKEDSLLFLFIFFFCEHREQDNKSNSIELDPCTCKSRCWRIT